MNNIKRKIVAAIVICVLLFGACSLSGCDRELKMNVLSGHIEAGASQTFYVLHTGDTHLTYADGRDSGKVRRHAKKRYARFHGTQEEKLQYVTALSAENGYVLVHTGDLLDFDTDKNIERAKEFFDETNCLYVPGNHEMETDDQGYIDKLSEASHHSLYFFCEEINGVCFVGWDNSDHNVTREQLDMLKEVVQTGKPIILLMHAPIYEESLFRQSVVDDGSAYLMGVPEEMMKDYPKDRYEQQKATEVTYEACEYIKAQSNIKAILAGHLHFAWESKVGNIPQYIVGTEDIRIIEIS